MAQDDLSPAVSNAAQNAKKRKRDDTSLKTQSREQNSFAPKKSKIQTTRINTGPSKTLSLEEPAGKKPSATPKNVATGNPSLLAVRQRLPIWQHSAEILAALDTSPILVLSGATGSGKSTQIPQFLLQAPWCQGKIAVTQPRRVAAISLAGRVAEEMGSPLGREVGYSVRFDEKVSWKTRIKFVTEGMLLQEMLRGAKKSAEGKAPLEDYSCVIVDEVHERSVNVDLILGFLKDMVLKSRAGIGPKRKLPLRIVVMSATADVKALRDFFESPLQAPTVASRKIGEEKELGVSPPNEHAKSITEQSRHDDPTPVSNGHTPEEKQPRPISHASQTSQLTITEPVSLCHVKGRQYPVKIEYLSYPTEDVIDSALQRIFQIHCKEPLPGDILVFLTGQETIQNLQGLVTDYSTNLPAAVPQILVIPLFAALPQAAQQRIFSPTPARTRKVILSTNIAETSITVPGVRFVIDTGKAKMKQFRPTLGLDSLLIKPISVSSADQRAGRAGREAPGQCFRLYTQTAYSSQLDKITPPEILRCDLSAAVLTILARGWKDNIYHFPFPTAPTTKALETALLHLLQLGALRRADGQISELGIRMSRLPLTPSLARVLLEAARPERGCLAAAIDVVAALSVENIFLPTHNTSDSSTSVTDDHELPDPSIEDPSHSRAGLIHRSGDHLTLLAVVRGYLAENSDRKQWTAQRALSHRAMRAVMDIRKQLRAYLQRELDSQDSTAASRDSSLLAATTTEDEHLRHFLTCFLLGFRNNIARRCPDHTYRSLAANHDLAIHPASTLFGRKVEAFVYNEFVFTKRAYARGVTAIRLSWLDEVLDYGQSREILNMISDE